MEAFKNMIRILFEELIWNFRFFSFIGVEHLLELISISYGYFIPLYIPICTPI